MADKEERKKRLLIKEYDLVCDLTDCEYCEEKDWCSEKDGITRQEAINLMADAISDAAKRSCNKKFVAEAALNALLDDKK